MDKEKKEEKVGELTKIFYGVAEKLFKHKQVDKEESVPNFGE